ncbi:unnamed protein product [Effrenium voratum]|nr:unnamed protein product [Effrenium voratum]
MVRYGLAYPTIDGARRLAQCLGGPRGWRFLAAGAFLEDSLQLPEDAPSQVQLQRAQQEADERRLSRELEAELLGATPQQLLKLCEGLSRQQVERTWSALSARVLELADSWSLADWRVLLTLRIPKADLALVEQAESAIAGLSTEADVQVLAACLLQLADLSGRRCSSKLLDAVSERLRGSDRRLSLSEAAGLGWVFASAARRDEEVLRHVLPVLESRPAEVRHVAKLATVCRVFEVPTSISAKWLLPEASQLVIRGDRDWPKVLPLVAMEPGAAYSHATQILLPELRVLTADDLLPVLEAFVIAGEQDLHLIYRVATRCCAFASHLDLEDSVRMASCLAHLNLRKEWLLSKLAANIATHQRLFTYELVEAMLKAWAGLQVPHRGLAEAIQHWLASASMEASQRAELASLLEAMSQGERLKKTRSCPALVQAGCFTSKERPCPFNSSSVLPGSWQCPVARVRSFGSLYRHSLANYAGVSTVVILGRLHPEHSRAS